MARQAARNRMDFLGTSFPLFRFAGITVRIHMLFIVYVAFRLMSARANFEWELISITMLFGIVLLHEFGHCFGARSVGGDAENILLWPLGGLAFADAPMRPWPQFVTVACGPLVNVVFFVVSAAVLIAVTGEWGVIHWNPLGNWGVNPFYLTARWQLWLGIFFDMNYMLFLFNMLPFFPMDGGQLFRAIIWPFVGQRRATFHASMLGLVGAALFAVWGLTKGQMTLVLFAIFGGMTCWQHLQHARHGTIEEEYTSVDPVLRYKRTRGFWSRLFGKSGATSNRGPLENPNPGGWQRRMDDEQRLHDEVDRILKKVSTEGVQSLTYVERQTLERARQEQLRRDH